MLRQIGRHDDSFEVDLEHQKVWRRGRWQPLVRRRAGRQILVEVSALEDAGVGTHEVDPAEHGKGLVEGARQRRPRCHVNLDEDGVGDRGGGGSARLPVRIQQHDLPALLLGREVLGHGEAYARGASCDKRYPAHVWSCLPRLLLMALGVMLSLAISSDSVPVITDITCVPRRARGSDG